MYDLKGKLVQIKSEVNQNVIAGKKLTKYETK